MRSAHWLYRGGLQAMQQGDYRQVSDEIRYPARRWMGSWIDRWCLLLRYGEDDSPAYRSSANWTNNKNRNIHETGAVCPGRYKLNEQWKPRSVFARHGTIAKQTLV
jgi:hypothetical protein